MGVVDQTLTISTRISVTDPAVESVLNDMCHVFSKAKYTTFSYRNKGVEIVKPDFMRKFGLSSRNFNSVIRSVDGMRKSQFSNMARYADEAEAKAENISRKIVHLQIKKKTVTDRIAKLQQDFLAKPWSGLLQDDIAKLKHKRELLIKGITMRSRRRDSLLKRRDQILKDIAAEHASVCFGSKKLFNAQHHLKANRFGDNHHWQRIWRKNRYNEFFSIGSKDETMGNVTCVLRRGEDGYNLRIKLMDAVASKHDKSHVELRNVRFAYREELIENIFVQHALRKEKEAEYNRLASKAGISKGEYLAPYGTAVTYRLQRDEKGWILYVTTDGQFEEAEFDAKNGVVGLDFNNGFISLANINKAGQKVETFDLSYDNRLEKSSKANDTAMQMLAIKVVDYAKSTGKPIVIESLDFRNKKGGLVSARGNELYHRMISRLSYAKFRQALKMQCLKQGVALKEVNPAYTSFIGRIKYARETNFSTHQAAAWCIGLVGMGKGVERMRLPIRFAIKQRGFLLDLSIPEDMAKVTSSKELSKVAKRVSKMVDNSVEKQRKVCLAQAEAKYERRTMDRIIQRLASDGSHRQVSKARSADEAIPY